MNSNHFSLVYKSIVITVFTRKVIRSQDNYIIIIGHFGANLVYKFQIHIVLNLVEPENLLTIPSCFLFSSQLFTQCSYKGYILDVCLLGIRTNP